MRSNALADDFSTQSQVASLIAANPNLPSLVLKARHLGGSAFCNFYRLGVPEQALGGVGFP